MIILAVVLVVLIGMAALAIDIGQLYLARQRAQNVCDSATLAAMAYLDGTPACAAEGSSARVWAGRMAETNNRQSRLAVTNPDTDDAGVAVDFPTGNITDSANQVITDGSGKPLEVPLGCAVRTRGYVRVNYSFARIFGKQGANVSASATALMRTMSYTASDLLVPLMVSDKTMFDGSLNFGDRVTSGTEVGMYVSDWQSGFVGSGNFGVIDVAGAGGNVFRDLLSGGSDRRPDFDLETTEIIDAESEPGGKVGPARQGLNNRLNVTETDPRFSGDKNSYNPATGASPAWDAWNAAYRATGEYPPTWRIALMPIVRDLNQTGHGKCDVQIVGFAAFFIEGVQYKKAGGGTDKIKIIGRFIQAVQIGTDYDWIIPVNTHPNAGNTAYTVNMIS